MTTTEELLSECACSDQMSAAQIYAHHQAGELPVQLLDECELVPPAEAILLAILGFVTVCVLAGLAGWVLYTIAPLAAAIH